MIATLAALLALAAAVVVYADRNNQSDVPIIATVTVKQESGAETADVNKDGAVDATDLLIITRNINESPLADDRADVDNSGAVDIADLAFVALHFNSRVVLHIRS